MDFNTVCLKLYKLACSTPDKKSAAFMLEPYSAKALKAARYHANFSSPKFITAKIAVAASPFEEFVKIHGTIFIQEMLKEIRNRFDLDENWRDVFDFFMTLVEQIPDEMLEELVSEEQIEQEKLLAICILMYYSLFPEPPFPAQMPQPPRPLSTAEFEEPLVENLAKTFGVSEERLKEWLEELQTQKEEHMQEEHMQEGFSLEEKDLEVRDMPLDMKLESLFSMASEQALDFMEDNKEEIVDYLQKEYEVDSEAFSQVLRDVKFQRQFEEPDQERLTVDEIQDQAYQAVSSEPETSDLEVPDTAADILEQGSGLPSFVSKEDELLEYAAGKAGTPEQQEEARTYFQTKYAGSIPLRIRLVLASGKLRR